MRHIVSKKLNAQDTGRRKLARHWFIIVATTILLTVIALMLSIEMFVYYGGL